MTVKQHSTVVDLIEHAVSTYQDGPAYTCLGHTLSFNEIFERSQRFASFLQNHTTLKPGDRIALQLPNILQYPIALYGAALAGLVIVNTNPLYTARELKHQLNDSGAKGLVVLSNVAHTVAEVVNETAVEAVIVTDLGDELPALKRCLVNSVVRYVKKLVPPYEIAGALSWRNSLSLGTAPVVKHPAQPDDLFLLQYTGGTTGVAKGAMLTHKNLCSNIRQVLNHLSLLFHQENENACAALPLYHIFAFNLHALSVFSEGGHNILIPNPRDIPAFVKAVAPWRLSLMVAVNTLYNALLQNEEFAKLDFSELKTCAAGGMAVTEDVSNRWHQLTGVQICEGYGLTETSPVLITNPDDAIVPCTIGTPLEDTQIKIVDEHGQVVAQGEPGEIYAKGPQVMRGYWQREEATAKVMEDGWFKTGDIGVKRDDGYYKIVDRKKDMISVSGFKVFPNEVEDIVTLHPGVLEAAVIGVPAKNVGEHVKLYAVLSDPEVSEQDVIEHCRKHLTAYKVPKIIEFRQSLPKSNVGKILRKDLRAELEKVSHG